MIANLQKHKSLEASLSYNIKKVTEGKASILQMKDVNMSISNPTVQSAIESFMSYLPPEFRTKKYVIHVSLNPPPGTEFGDFELNNFAKQYLEKMGLVDPPYIVFKHNDIERTHIHIVTLNVDKEGKRIIHDFEKMKSKKATEEIVEENLELKSAIEKHNQESNVSQSLEESPEPISYDNSNLKNKTSKILDHVIKSYNFTSIGEFNAILSQFNVKATIIASDEGVKGLAYSVTDDNGESISKPIHSHEMKPSLRYQEIEKEFLKNLNVFKSKHPRIANIMASKKSRIKHIVAQALLSTSTEKEFSEYLEKWKIKVIFNKKRDLIYGVSFVDNYSMVSMKGSRVHRDFSAKNISMYLDDKSTFNYQDFISDDYTEKSLKRVKYKLYEVSKKASNFSEYISLLEKEGVIINQNTLLNMYHGETHSFEDAINGLSIEDYFEREKAKAIQLEEENQYEEIISQQPTENFTIGAGVPALMDELKEERLHNKIIRNQRKNRRHGR